MKQPPVPWNLRIGSEHKLRNENLAYDIDVWYPLIKEHTFHTVFIPLRVREAEAVVAHFRTVNRIKRQRDVSWVDVAVLESLEQRLQAALDEHFAGGGAFLRLCGRSPKDADPLTHGQITTMYQEKLDSLVTEEGRPLDDNTRLEAACKMPLLKIEDSTDAMSLLLTSERVHADLIDWLQYGEPEQIVLRAWEPQLSLDFEFRAYIHQGQLNGISQYDHYAVYPHLRAEIEKHDIVGKIRSLWQTVHPLVGVPSYCMDFAWLPEDQRVVVIELSPFLPCTGAACFSWKVDGTLLRDGPFELRLHSGIPHPQLPRLLEDWLDRWKQPFTPYWEHWKKPMSEKPSSLITPALVSACISALSTFSWAMLPSSMPLPYVDDISAKAAMAAIGVSSGVAALLTWLAGVPVRKRMKAALSQAMGTDSGFTVLFVYGTLKRGFHWHDKYMWRAAYLGEATTVKPYPLVVGDCGVPYVLRSMEGSGHRLQGELYLVDQECLQGLDEYEGVPKDYYVREHIQVEHGALTTVQAYFPKEDADFADKLKDLPFIANYSLDIHRQQYRPIRHIEVKQGKYLWQEKDQHCSHGTS